MGGGDYDMSDELKEELLEDLASRRRKSDDDDDGIEGATLVCIIALPFVLAVVGDFALMALGRSPLCLSTLWGWCKSLVQWLAA